MTTEKIWLKVRKLKWLQIHDIQPTLKQLGIVCRIQIISTGDTIYHCYYDKSEEHFFLRSKETKTKVWYYLV